MSSNSPSALALLLDDVRSLRRQIGSASNTTIPPSSRSPISSPITFNLDLTASNTPSSTANQRTTNAAASSYSSSALSPLFAPNDHAPVFSPPPPLSSSIQRSTPPTTTTTTTTTTYSSELEEALLHSSSEVDLYKKLLSQYKKETEPQLEALRASSIHHHSHHAVLMQDVRALSDFLRVTMNATPLDSKPLAMSRHLSPPGSYEKRKFQSDEDDLSVVQSAMENARVLADELERLRATVRQLSRDLVMEKKMSSLKEDAMLGMKSEMDAFKELFEREGREVRMLHSLVQKNSKNDDEENQKKIMLLSEQLTCKDIEINTLTQELRQLRMKK